MTFWHFLASILKLSIASLVVGAGLTYLDLSAADLLARVGLTPQRVAEWAQEAVTWALPNVMLGSMIVIPVWILLSLFRPPGRG
jgi:hypothetical protein